MADKTSAPGAPETVEDARESAFRDQIQNRNDQRTMLVDDLVKRRREMLAQEMSDEDNQVTAEDIVAEQRGEDDGTPEDRGEQGEGDENREAGIPDGEGIPEDESATGDGDDPEAAAATAAKGDAPPAKDDKGDEDDAARQAADDGAEDKDKEEDKATDEGKRGGAAAEPPSDKSGAPGAPAAQPGERLLTVRVDGVEKQLPESEVIKGFQLAEASTKRFREARDLQQQAEEERRRAEAQASAAPKQQQESEAKDTSGAEPSLDADRVREWTRAIQYGTEDEAAEAIKQLTEATRGTGGPREDKPTLDPQEIIQQAASVARRQTAYENALTNFQRDFPDIVNDPYLVQNTANTVHVIRGEDLRDLGYEVDRMTLQQVEQTYRQEQDRGGPVRGDYELFKSAGERVRKWRDDLVNPAREEAERKAAEEKEKEAADKQRETRAARKRSIEQPPRPASARSGIGQDEQAAPSPSQVISKMREARGLPNF